MTALAGDVLAHDHSELDDLLSATFVALDSEDPVISYQKLDLFWARLAMHIRAEHLWLFPAVLRSDRADDNPEKLGSTIKNVIERLRQDHDHFMHELARAIKEMRIEFSDGNREETFAVARGVLNDVKVRLAEHNTIEETLIYPLAAGDVMGEAAAERLRIAVEGEVANMPSRFPPIASDGK